MRTVLKPRPIDEKHFTSAIRRFSFPTRAARVKRVVLLTGKIYWPRKARENGFLSAIVILQGELPNFFSVKARRSENGKSSSSAIKAAPRKIVGVFRFQTLWSVFLHARERLFCFASRRFGQSAFFHCRQLRLQKTRFRARVFEFCSSEPPG